MPSLAAQERRTALVIGNSTYRKAPLPNPVNDARAMATTLGSLGFTVTKLENASKTQMAEAIRGFGEAIKRGGVGLFYFAGHGIQADGENFLIPVDADIQDMQQVKVGGVDMSLILQAINQAKNNSNIVILDACRNNPFRQHLSRGLAPQGNTDGHVRTESAAGLAPIAIGGLANTLIAYATAPNEVAADGSGQNGVYTDHLLRNLTEPGLKVEEVFKRTRFAVRQETDGRQVPWENSSLEGDFYFVAPSVSALASSETVRQSPAALRDQQAALQPSRSGVGSTLSAPNRTGFSFAREEEKERASQSAQSDAIRARLQTPCPGARRQEPIVIDITEESRSDGLVTSERSSRFAELLQWNLQQAGLDASLASSGGRSAASRKSPARYQGRYAIQGVVLSEQGSNRLVRLNEASLSAELVLRDRSGRIVTMVEVSGESFAGQNTSAATRALGKEQAADAASQLYSAFCGGSVAAVRPGR
ncbi:MAG: caspase domain-containing protein [Candidatus Tectimicrobiota bacterium]